MAGPPPGNETAAGRASWRERLYRVIFEAETPAGRAFDLLLIIAILLSVLAVMVESVAAYRVAHGRALRLVEWGFTILFSIEYVLRLISARSAARYARSFFGIVDLFAVLPTYLAVLIPGAQYFLVIRMMRVLRVFRVLKLAKYVDQANVLAIALRNSRQKIEVFLVTVVSIVVVFGALMYFIEGEENGFTSIPTSVYWAIVTLTTVGYGDISPQTPLGQALAAAIMIMGYGIIAVPTGIVTTELARVDRDRAGTGPLSHRACPRCGTIGHATDAAYCRYCGARLEPLNPPATTNDH